MVSSASAGDRFYRAFEPLVGVQNAEYLMRRLLPVDADQIATKDDLALLGKELRTEMRELRAEMREGFADIRGQMVTRSELSEILSKHVDARIGEVSRWWMFSTMGLQAATIAGVIAAVRL